MAYEYLFREGQINSMTVRNRLTAGPMERNFANRDGSLTQRYIDYLTERARGGAGLVMVESTYVDTRGMGHHYQVGAHGDHVIPGMRRLADSIHAGEAKVGYELYMGGRETPSYMSHQQPIAPSVVRCEVLHPPVPTPREMTTEDIKEVIGKFVDAARRVRDAGIDYILLHGAHGYLLCQFVSPFSNKRTDEYGGSEEKRARFPLEVLSAVREVVGADFPIGFRLSAEEYVEGGLTAQDTARFCQMLKEGGIDMVDVSGGIYESFQMIIQGAEAPKGGFVRNAKIIKDAVGDLPVSVAQRLNDPDLANNVLKNEGLDFISLSRAFHADPHWAKKVSEGQMDEIIPCIACHYCTNLLEENRPTFCAVNPRTGMERERQIRPAAQARKVLVIGGGPAGMTAARMLAEQGHQVTLFEKTSNLGGQMRYSSLVADDYGYLVTYLSRQMEKLNVDVHLNSPATDKTIHELQPDAVIVATGAAPGLGFCPVKGNPRTFDIFNCLERPDDDWEDRVVIVGGDYRSCFVALYAAGRGSEVHLVEPSHVLSADKGSPARDLLLASIENLPIVTFRTESTVEEIGEGYVVIQKGGEFERLEEVGSVIVGGVKANNLLYEAIKEQTPDAEIYNIGDSVVPRDVFYATQEAAQVVELVGLRGRTVA